VYTIVKKEDSNVLNESEAESVNNCHFTSARDLFSNK